MAPTWGGCCALDWRPRCATRSWRRPLPPGEECSVDARRLDTLCFACSDRRLVDDPFPHPPAWMSAWHGGRLAMLDATRAPDRDAIDAAGLRVVLLDHLYVEGGTALRSPRLPERDARDPSPPPAIADLQQRVSALRTLDTTPGRPGLDARPVILHVLHVEPEPRKHLGVVRERVLDLSNTLIDMLELPHREDAGGRPEGHPEVRRVAASFATASSMISRSGTSSEASRDRLSVESIHRVTTSTPTSSHQPRTSEILSAPRWWPVVGSRPMDLAQRRLPSRITPTCRGIRSRGRLDSSRRSYRP